MYVVRLETSAGLSFEAEAHSFEQAMTIAASMRSASVTVVVQTPEGRDIAVWWGNREGWVDLGGQAAAA